jgi:hypothetical protein
MFDPEREAMMIDYATGVMAGVAVQAARNMATELVAHIDLHGELPRCHVASAPETAVDAAVDHNLTVRARKIGEVITIHHNS